jgi:2-polyprenyl-3-methyl-5-hydroxy-6-metoxy-1,4-benzoquinol methylase
MARLVDSEIELNRIAHKTPEYGAGGHRHAGTVKQLIDAYGHDVLDYGCGKQTLSDALGIPVHGYDPAIRGLDAEPKPADIVVCTDVLEHVREEELPEVLDHINSLTRKIALLIIATRSAIKYHHDGTNFHRTIKPANWWVKLIMNHMDLSQFALNPDGSECMLTCFPKGTDEENFVIYEEHMKEQIDMGNMEIKIVSKEGNVERKRFGVDR